MVPFWRFGSALDVAPIISDIKAYSLNLEIVFCKLCRITNKAVDFIAKYVNRCGWLGDGLSRVSSTRSLVFVGLISQLSLFVWPFDYQQQQKIPIYNIGFFV